MRRFLALFIILICVSVAGLLLKNYQFDGPENSPKTGLLPEIDLALEKISYSETDNGERRWFLEASNAVYDHSEGVATLEQVDFHYFFPEQSRGRLEVSSRSGELGRDQKTLVLRGSVEIFHPEEDRRFLTEELRYFSEEKIFRAPGEVLLESPSMTVQGEGLILDVQQERMELSRNVEAVFHENP